MRVCVVSDSNTGMRQLQVGLLIRMNVLGMCLLANFNRLQCLKDQSFIACNRSGNVVCK